MEENIILVKLRIIIADPGGSFLSLSFCDATFSRREIIDAFLFCSDPTKRNVHIYTREKAADINAFLRCDRPRVRRVGRGQKERWSSRAVVFKIKNTSSATTTTTTEVEGILVVMRPTESIIY